MIQNPNIVNIAQQQAMLNQNYGDNPLLNMPTAIDVKSAENKIKDSSTVAKKSVEMLDPEVLLKIPLYFIPVYAMQLLLARRFGGKFTESVFGKFAKGADKFAESKLVKPVIDKIFQGWDKVCSRAKWLTGKSKVAKAMSMPTSPEFSMAKPMSKGALGFATSDVDDLFKAVRKKYGNNINLDELFKKTCAGRPEKSVDEFVQILREGCKPSDLKDMIKFLESLKLPDEFVYYRMGLLPPRKMSPNLVANTLRALTGEGIDTRFGKFAADGFVKFFEAITGAMVGGAGSIMMQSMFTSYAIERSRTAKKGEKLATGMEEFIQQVAFFATMPLSMKLMHMLGGLKYTGLDEASKKRYQDALKTYNAVGYATRAERQAAKTQLKKLLKGDARWFHKPFKMIGNVIAFGLEKLNPVKGSKLSWLSVRSKGFFGGLLRVFFSAMVTAPLVGNPFVRLSHLIFGKPSDSILDSSSDEEKKHPEVPIELNDIFVPNEQSATQSGAQMPGMKQPQQYPQGEYLAGGQVPASPMSQIAAKPVGPKRTYLPSPVAPRHVEQPQELEIDPKIQKALEKADKAEEAAMEFLNKKA